jgi:hypothetical protein
MDRSVEARLADELAIRALVARHCHAIAERDDEAWAETFAADGEWLVLGQQDGLVELHGDEASGQWQIAETLQLKDGRPLVNVGRYRDRYRRDADGAWRFLRRELRLSYSGPADYSAESHPPEGWKRG